MKIPSKYPEANRLTDFTQALISKPKKKVDKNWHSCITCGTSFYSKGMPKYCWDCKPL